MRFFSDFICARITMYHSHTVLLLLSSTIALQVNIVERLERGLQIKILISLPRRERERETERETERGLSSILASSKSLF